jgi:hypothetical protein
VLLALALGTAVALAWRAQRAYLPGLEVDAGQGLRITILIHGRGSQGACEEATARAMAELRARCPQCGLSSLGCPGPWRGEWHRRLAEGRADAFAVVSEEGRTLIRAPERSQAQAVCEAMAAELNRLRPGNARCLPPAQPESAH